VRLPNGVFCTIYKYPNKPTFFRPLRPYQNHLVLRNPATGRLENYTKTKPMQFEEFADCIAWFKRKRRDENEHSWSIPAEVVLKYNQDGNLLSCNLDLKNPNNPDALEHLPPAQLAADILKKERRIIEIMEEIRTELGGLEE